MDRFPESIAIAGAWGYIGRKILEAALSLGIKPYVYDPGDVPDDMDLRTVTRMEDEGEFYRLNADLYHLALHPEQRVKGEDILFQRAASEPVVILNEKPMAPPEHPERCVQIVQGVNNSEVTMLYDFPELFDPMTRRIIGHLSGFDDLKIISIFLQRSKDREAPDDPRNYRKMLPVQYQESVHCVAFLLYLLGKLKGSLDAVFSDGLSVVAEADPYVPPNPEDYPYVVDGRCAYTITLGDLTVEGLTDFKRNAEWKKQRIIRGIADRKAFTIEVEYLEGGKHLFFDGVDQRFDPAADSYEAIISTLAEWHRAVSADELNHGLYPNPEFAQLTYQLSSVLWKSSHGREPITVGTLDELKAFDAGFPAACRKFPPYTGRK